ncbi:hypothetical protein [Ferrimonas balearica]|uniref:hypothetical protein n=1 Tax=Ferrimonas balearica TaxID=44012 RepID=UPI001C99ABFD|nr:hypothetical protein [Ferrimonas balearica]MBY5992803.1 hypothetical protein [Ferrimonas balearica]
MSELSWHVEGIWKTPKGHQRDIRYFNGSKEHVEKVLQRLEGKGRLLRRLKFAKGTPHR